MSTLMPASFVQTDRLRIAYRRAGDASSRKFLFLHGNLSSSVFLVPLFDGLAQSFEVVAPDLRCFGETEALPVDATRGYRDFSDDIDSLVEALAWDSFVLAGWSMGGNIAMQYAIDHCDKVEKLVLWAPGSPFGFGGSIDELGTTLEPVGLGSGAGTANPALVLAVEQGSRFMLRDTLANFFFTPPFRIGRSWENRMIEAISRIHTGNEYFPGDYSRSSLWPYVVAGEHGVLNAMSSKYGRLDDFLLLAGKLELLWIHGDNDRIVSDSSLMDMGYLGSIGLVPGWPGAELYPVQPMETQLRSFFERFATLGGQVQERVITGGHMCALESPEAFFSAIREFVR